MWGASCGVEARFHTVPLIFNHRQVSGASGILREACLERIDLLASWPNQSVTRTGRADHVRFRSTDSSFAR